LIATVACATITICRVRRCHFAGRVANPVCYKIENNIACFNVEHDLDILIDLRIATASEDISADFVVLLKIKIV
jgi:hypothetical protein